MRTIKMDRLTSVVSGTESTEIGMATTKAQGIIFRPIGGFKGAPILRKLWEFASDLTPMQELQALTHPTESRNLDTTDQTVAVRIYKDGKSILLFYNMTATGSIAIGPRGLFELEEDTSYRGFTDATSGPPLYEVLATGLDKERRWFGEMISGQLSCQNGVDDAVAVQVSRTLTPGRWRKRGSNAVPPAPVITIIEPETSVNTQAKRTITAAERAGSADLVFTAHPENFIGEAATGKIKVAIDHEPYSTSIRSTITGEGTVQNPFVYTIFTSPSFSSNDKVVQFVNLDTNAIPILTASTSAADNTADTFQDVILGTLTPVLLTGGTGSGSSTGLTNEVIDVYARYWDGGVKGLGYEGPSSLVSNQIIIDGATNKDLVVTVDIDPSAEGGRFAHENAGIRIYKRFGEVDPVWSLMNDEQALPNSYREMSVATDIAADKLWSKTSSRPATSNAGTGALTAASAPALGSIVVLDKITGAANAWTEYYVVNVVGLTFKLSLTSGGASLPLGTVAGINVHVVSAHSWTTGDIVVMTGATAPAGTVIGTRYYIESVGSRWVKLTSQRRGTAIDMTVIGSSDLTLKVVAVMIVIGSNADPGRAMSTDQNRPPAHRYITLAGEFAWIAGLTQNESFIMSSKDKQHDEVMPEGVDLQDIDTINKGSSAITGLWSDRKTLHVHCDDGIIMIDPTTSAQQQPLLDFGAVNGGCITTIVGNRIIFLTKSRDLVAFNGARYGDRSWRPAAEEATEYIKSFIPIDDMSLYADRCAMMHDMNNDMIFFWLPKIEDRNASPHVVTMTGFVYDVRSRGISGPFYQPLAAFATCRLDKARGQYVVCDKDGYLFVMDTNEQGDEGDEIVQGDITLHAAGAELPDDHQGFKVETISVNGVNQDIWYACKSVIDTGMVGIGAQMTRFTGLRWRTISGSRGYARITFIGHNGSEKTITYGEMGSKQRNRPHEVRLSLTDSAVKVRMEIFAGDYLKWEIRDLQLVYEA